MDTNISEWARALFAPGAVVDLRRRIVEVAKANIDGSDACGILLLDPEPRTTPAEGDSTVARIDGLQVEAGEGPSWAALSEGGAACAGDLARDARWPVFGPRASAAGIRSALSLRLSTPRLSVLNFYAHRPEAFADTDLAAALIFATLAGLALDSAIDREEDARKTANLLEALRTRESIGQAQGILMERERITADQAFDRLRRASQSLNVKLREVAESIVETGESPTRR